MGVTRSFPPNRPLKAEDVLESEATQLYVMPVSHDALEEEATAPFPIRSGKLLYMPSRWGSSATGARVRSLRPFRGDAVDWPREYPRYDDL